MVDAIPKKNRRKFCLRSVGRSTRTCNSIIRAKLVDLSSPHRKGKLTAFTVILSFSVGQAFAYSFNSIGDPVTEVSNVPIAWSVHSVRVDTTTAKRKIYSNNYQHVDWVTLVTYSWIARLTAFHKNLLWNSLFYSDWYYSVCTFGVQITIPILRNRQKNVLLWPSMVLHFSRNYDGVQSIL